ncbi:hypothetical protein HDU77_000715 [Chytriomyces hyalinus]|nr:hypothetical protein HDU77_000715 [Chytriomyces hyalinus]
MAIRNAGAAGQTPTQPNASSAGVAAHPSSADSPNPASANAFHTHTIQPRIHLGIKTKRAPGWTASRSQNVSNALEYRNKVKDLFQSQPKLRNTFLNITK